jgi:hypothetical protein
VAAALSPPLAVAALVLCVAGLAKLRSPAAAVRAMSGTGLAAVGSAPIRAAAAAEFALGTWCLLAPTAISCAIMACVYTAFAGLAVLLTRRASSCGCFGDDRAPASIVQSMISIALALVCLAGARWVPHGVLWMLGRPASFAAVLVVGTAGAAYATVLAYTELPLAWHSWSPR